MGCDPRTYRVNKTSRKSGGKKITANTRRENAKYTVKKLIELISLVTFVPL